MPKRPDRPARPRAVREPMQVYLAADDSALLARLASETGLSKAEILRRGVRAFARAQGIDSPMLRFVQEGAGGEWPADVAERHDEALTEAYLPEKRKRR